jgi:spore germination protein KB
MPYYSARFSVTEAGMAAWQLILLSDLLSLGGVYLTLKVIEKFPLEDFASYTRKLGGFPLYTLLSLLVMLFFFSRVILLTRGVTDFTRMSLLPTTPQWAISMLFLLPVAYSVSYGLGPLARVIDLLMLFGIPLVFLSLLTLLSNTYFDFLTDLWLWKPSIFTSLNFFATFYFYTFSPVLYLLYPKMNATPKKIMTVSFAVIIISTLFVYLPVTYFPLLTFGYEGYLNFRSPLYSAMKDVSVNIYLLRNIHVIYYLLWTILSLAGACLHLYCAMRILFTLLSFIKNGSWLIPFALLPGIVYAANLASSVQFLKWIQFAGVFAMFITLALPVLLLALYTLQNKHHKDQEI